MNSGRLVGIILIVVGIGVAVVAGLWIATQVSGGVEDGEFSGGAAVTTAGVAFIPVALLVGFGIYMMAQGGAREKEQSAMAQQRRLLDIVKSRGQISVSDVALEMRVPVEGVRDMVHQLVGLQVFSGYINWNDGILYSAEASQLRELDKCKNCGGAIELAGKGVMKCRFCGTEYFLS